MLLKSRLIKCNHHQGGSEFADIYPRNITFSRPLDRPIAFHDIRQYTAKQKMSFAYDFEKHVPSEKY